MKKLIPIIVLVAVVGFGAYYLSSSGQKSDSQMSSQMDKSSESSTSGSQMDPMATGVNRNRPSHSPLEGLDEEDDDDEFLDLEERPAAEVYKNAEEALAAVKAGAADYDDIVLEQFVEPGENCTWCDKFYGELKTLLANKSTTEDELSYYSELLAISGRVDNVSTLVETIKAVGDNEQGDIFAEALELTIGDDKVVKYLSDQTETSNELLHESVIAAITNQGSQLAAEVLYRETEKEGDPDGFYSLGIGLGEFVPEDEALPYLQELAQKRDQYSHLAVKALLNSGVDGLKLVSDLLETSSNSDADRELLKDAVDHVSYDEDTENYLKQILQKSKNPELRKFAQESLDDMNALDDEDDVIDGSEEVG